MKPIERTTRIEIWAWMGLGSVITTRCFRELIVNRVETKSS
jgi:hypothetical protein